MIINPQPWEVWFAKVKFEDNPQIVKNRPVLVLENNQCYLLSLKITSHTPRNNYLGEYALSHWQDAGLSKPSTVRISKRLKLVLSDFVFKTGRLHPVDMMNIQQIINTLY